MTVYDDAPGNRGQREGSQETRSGPPPPPTVTASRGALCNDTPGSGLPACAAAFQTPCVDVDCGYLRLTVTFAPGAERDYDCRITNGSAAHYRDETIDIRSSYDQQTYIWYGGGRVGIDCGPDRQAATARYEFGWPDSG